MMHKPHTWVEISRTALEHNLAQLKTIVQNKVLAPVIKGNAYGHGLFEVGRVCQESPHVDWVCVALLSEALTLRNDGFTKPILVLVHLDDDPHLAIEHDIDVIVYGQKALTSLHSCAKKIKKPCRVHIKIDTGLSRLGLNPKQAVQFIKQAQKLPWIEVRGIATHFAQSNTQNRETMHEQLDSFFHLLAQLEQENIKIPYQHICNSAAMVRIANPPGTFFRPGLSVYGYWSSEQIKKDVQTLHPNLTLKPVLSWKTRIFNTKKVSAQQAVGYGSTYRTNRESNLAVIPVGYADGYSKSFENGNGVVLVNKKLAPIVGTIGMNITIIDVTDISNVRVGDEIFLVADCPGIRADQIANRCVKNPREITTIISEQIPRILV